VVAPAVITGGADGCEKETAAACVTKSGLAVIAALGLTGGATTGRAAMVPVATSFVETLPSLPNTSPTSDPDSIDLSCASVAPTGLRLVELVGTPAAGAP